MKDYNRNRPDSFQVLVVDDTQESLRLLTEILEAEMYKVRSASSGRIALMSASVEAPDIILLDVNMPDMNGYEVCRQLKKDPALKTIPVIFISALDTTEDKVSGFNAGGVDYITKPYQSVEVLARVGTHLELQRFRKQLARQLRESKELMQSLIDNSIAVIYLKDAEGKYLLINRRFEELFHVQQDDIAGKSDYDVFPKETADAFHALDQRVLDAGKPLTEEEVAPHDDGPHTYISTKAPLLDEAGKPYAVCGISTDITERKQAEEEVRRLNKKLHEKIAQLNDAQEELVRKEKLSILGQLAGSLGHEIRNPLGVMNNAVYFLKTVLADADETVLEYLDIINREIGNAQRIITDLLDFSRTKTPQASPFDVTAVVEQSLNKCRMPETIKTSVEIPDGLPFVNADRFQMIQVLNNIMVNAIQAMPKKGGLHIKGRESDGFVKISITDTGTGISPENMKKLFLPLFTTKPKGIGLGLVVCKNLVEANGGEITVESQLGQGTTFTILLPVSR